MANSKRWITGDHMHQYGILLKQNIVLLPRKQNGEYISNNNMHEKLLCSYKNIQYKFEDRIKKLSEYYNISTENIIIFFSESYKKHHIYFNGCWVGRF